MERATEGWPSSVHGLVVLLGSEFHPAEAVAANGNHVAQADDGRDCPAGELAVPA